MEENIIQMSSKTSLDKLGLRRRSLFHITLNKMELLRGIIILS